MSRKHQHLAANSAHWRRSNSMKVFNTDIALQLSAETLGLRLWRLAPGEASTYHRHRHQEELYVLLEGEGRIRFEDETLTLEPLDALLVPARELRQIFNDTNADALWLCVGAPPEHANTLEMTDAELSDLYPEGVQALPPELTT
jgi:uncharacterized cupin superfamily protein